MVATPEFEQPSKQFREADDTAETEYIKFDADNFPTQSVTEVIVGLAWVATNILTAQECDEWIQRGEEFGLVYMQSATRRRNKRTKNFQDQQMSDLALSRLPGELVGAIEATGMCTKMQGLHPNWRIVRYDEGDQFPAHQDQQDEFAIMAADGINERFRSTHTLVISLSGCSSCEGGATRFFPDGTCGRSVDVHLPRGAALIFQQKNLYHSGMPVLSGTKYIAQAGLLRALPTTGKIDKPHIFKYGCGLQYAASNSDANDVLKEQGQLYYNRYAGVFELVVK